MLLVNPAQMTAADATGGRERRAPATIVRDLTQADLDAIALVHGAAFPDSALAKLGHEAVRRYYEWQLVGPHEGVALGASIDGRLAGFCFGGVFRSSMGGFLRRNRGFLALRVLARPWLLAAPLFRDRLVAGVAALTRGRGAAEPRQAVRSFGILAIAVDPELQGRGVGRRLMHASERIACTRGFDVMHLTVHPDTIRPSASTKSCNGRADCPTASGAAR